jgi:hypothetical protein
MAWTENDLVVLEKAIAQGATRVKYADKEVEYRSLQDMLIIRQQIIEELFPGVNDLPPGRKFGTFDKGIK